MMPCGHFVRFVSLFAVLTDDGALVEVFDSAAAALKYPAHDETFIIEGDTEKARWVASCGQWVPYLPWAGGEA